WKTGQPEYTCSRSPVNPLSFGCFPIAEYRENIVILAWRNSQEGLKNKSARDCRLDGNRIVMQYCRKTFWIWLDKNYSADSRCNDVPSAFMARECCRVKHSALH